MHASCGVIIRTNARAGANDRLELGQALCRSSVGTVYNNLGIKSAICDRLDLLG